jgi:hypothetical protein
VVFEPNFLEEVGDGQLLSPPLTKAIFRPRGQLLREIQSRDAEAKPSQSQFEAGRPLRRRCCWTIYESSGHPFHVPSFVKDSRDLGEHDQISLEAIRHCNDVPLRFLKEIKKPPPQRKGPEM